jgi:hypothetical protein
LLLEGLDLETNYFDFGKVYINFDPIKKNKKRILLGLWKLILKGLILSLKRLKMQFIVPLSLIRV